jgi:hypothetical protein
MTHVLRLRIRGNVKIFGPNAKQQIAHRPAD